MENFHEFLDFWDRQIEPIYYFLFHQWLYGNGTDPTLKKKQLARVFRLLRGPAPQLAFVKNFPHLLKTALEEIRSSFEPQHLRFHVVSSVGPEAVSSRRLWSRLPARDDGTKKCCSEQEHLDENYLVFSPLELASNPEVAAILVRKEILLASLWHAHGQSLGMEVFHQGLSLYLALEMEGRTFPSFPEERLPAYRNKLTNDLSKRWDETERYRFAVQKDFRESSGCVVGYDFARTLLNAHSLKEAIKLNETEVAEEWTRYLQ